MLLRNTPKTEQLSDPDLIVRSERLVPKSIDSRIIAREQLVRDGLSDLRGHLAKQQSVVLPLLRKAGIAAFENLGTLSRISARPAVLAKLASAKGIRKQPMVVRVILVPMASLFIALGVSMQLSSGLGVGPGDMVASGISSYTGLSFGNSAIIFSGLIALTGTVLGRPPKTATLVNVGLIAMSIDLLLPHLAIEGAFLARALYFAGGLWSVGIGIGCLLHARLGIGTHEALSLGIAGRTGLPVAKVRLMQELTWIVIGLGLGSQFGVGTVVVALFIAPAIASGTRMVGKVLTTLSNAVEAPEVAAHVSDVGF